MLQKVTTCVLIPLFVIIAGSGCLTRKKVPIQSQQSINLVATTAEADRFWQAAEDTLRRHRYQLDRVDRNDGIITTLPEPSQHITEPWRSDVHTWRDLMESTINPIRRWIEVRFHRNDADLWNSVEVIVHKERLSSPDRQFNNTGASYAFFGYSLPSTTGLAKVTPKDDIWVSLGRDSTTEAYLLAEIVECADVVVHKND